MSVHLSDFAPASELGSIRTPSSPLERMGPSGEPPAVESDVASSAPVTSCAPQTPIAQKDKKRHVLIPNLVEKAPPAVKASAAMPPPKLSSKFKSPLLTRTSSPPASRTSSSLPPSDLSAPTSDDRAPVARKRAKPNSSFKPLKVVHPNPRALPSLASHEQSPPSSSSSPREGQGAPTRAEATRQLAKPFLVPLKKPGECTSSSRPSGKGSTLLQKKKAEVKRLSDRLHLLRTALNLLKGPGAQADEETRALSVKWKDAAKEAAYLLWEHAPKLNPKFGEGAGEPWGFGGESSSGGGAFSSSWGFGDERRKESAFGGSLFASAPTPEQTLEEFKEQVRLEARNSGQTEREVLAELNAETFPSADEILQAGLKRKALSGQSTPSKRARLTTDSDDDEEERMDPLPSEEMDEEEIEERARELMRAAEEERERLVDEQEREERGEDEEERPEEKWHLGRLLREIGVFPGDLDWDDDLEDFKL